MSKYYKIYPNLNQKYLAIDYKINKMKEKIANLNFEDLLLRCPILTIPEKALIFHSNKYSTTELLQEINIFEDNSGYYPSTNGCKICKITNPLPEELIGSKPRITELVANPNVNNKGCICLYGRQQRLYGNFNFVGNYDISIKTKMKGTEVFVVTRPLKLIDLSYLSIELGFSPKRFSINNQPMQNDFSELKNYTSFCKKQNLDGLIMLDTNDKQEITDNFVNEQRSAFISCYSVKGKNVFVCPEIVLIHELGEGGNLGTSKLMVLGMVDLVDDKNNKLSRDHVTLLMNKLFTKFSRIFGNIYNTVDFNIGYYNNNLYKSIIGTVNNRSIEIGDIINVIRAIRNSFNITSTFIKYNDDTQIAANLFSQDYNLVNIFTRDNKLLNYDELWFPGDMNTDIEIVSKLILNKELYPLKNNPQYVYIDGTPVVSYISDKLFEFLFSNEIFNFYNNRYSWYKFFIDSQIDFLYDIEIKSKGFFFQTINNYLLLINTKLKNNQLVFNESIVNNFFMKYLKENIPTLVDDDFIRLISGLLSISEFIYKYFNNTPFQKKKVFMDLLNYFLSIGNLGHVDSFIRLDDIYKDEPGYINLFGFESTDVMMQGGYYYKYIKYKNKYLKLKSSN